MLNFVPNGLVVFKTDKYSPNRINLIKIHLYWKFYYIYPSFGCIDQTLLNFIEMNAVDNPYTPGAGAEVSLRLAVSLPMKVV
jgi:hypothetical protein